MHSVPSSPQKKPADSSRGLQVPAPSQESALARKAYESYLRWENQTKLLIVASETPMVDGELRFGGTWDALAIIDGRLCLLDWKRSRDQVLDGAAPVQSAKFYPQRTI